MAFGIISLRNRVYVMQVISVEDNPISYLPYAAPDGMRRLQPYELTLIQAEWTRFPRMSTLWPAPPVCRGERCCAEGAEREHLCGRYPRCARCAGPTCLSIFPALLSPWAFPILRAEGGPN